MALYQSKPVTVEAWRYQSDPNSLCPNFVHIALAQGRIVVQPTCLVVTTNHGETQCNPGDWIICGPSGEVYPCNDATFRAKYEAADREAALMSNPALVARDGE